MTIRPLDDRLLNEHIDQEARTRWGLIIPDTAKENPVGGSRVIDPTEVVRAELKNAASVASLLLT
jgi:co-chaperonin GroES (HSP10)